MKKSGSKERRRRTSSLTNNMIQDMELDAIKEKISNKHKQMVKEIDEKLDKIFDDFLNEITKMSLNRFEVEKLFDDGKNGKSKPKLPAVEAASDDKDTTKAKLKPRLILPEKTFQPRNSLLTDLFEIKHIRTIYHTFIVIFNLLLLNVFVSDFADTGNINIGLGPIITGFGGFQYAIAIWLSMQATVMSLYPTFICWARITRKFFSEKGFLTSFWHFNGVCMVIGYHVAFIYFFTVALVHFDMAQASSVAVLMELVRFLMKSYAFIRTNVPRVLNGKNKLKVDELGWDSPDLSPGEDSKEKESLGTSRVNDKRFLPSFGQYVYFLFAPTLVYRDEYPRTKQIRWKFVAKNFVEVIAVIFIYSLISERIMYPFYNQFGSQHYEIEMKELIASVFNCMLPGLLCFLCGFYCILHSWQNAFAEMLRFADRRFYSDWWNSSNFSVYYRTWNIIVHDWLYQYVYKDLYEIVTRRNVIVSQLLVFSLSAVFHEYILGFTFKFFYPILFLQFQGAGVLLIFITKKEHKGFGNIFMWLALAMGMGMLLSMYHMEVYARVNCDYDKNDFSNRFYPISWTCNGVKYSDNWEMKIRL